jgi:hypothetical protein
MFNQFLFKLLVCFHSQFNSFDTTQDDERERGQQTSSGLSHNSAASTLSGLLLFGSNRFRHTSVVLDHNFKKRGNGKIERTT